MHKLLCVPPFYPPPAPSTPPLAPSLPPSPIPCTCPFPPPKSLPPMSPCTTPSVPAHCPTPFFPWLRCLTPPPPAQWPKSFPPATCTETQAFTLVNCRAMSSSTASESGLFPPSHQVELLVQTGDSCSQRPVKPAVSLGEYSEHRGWSYTLPNICWLKPSGNC